MNKRKLILIGGGGHCKSCIDVIESLGTFEIEGILDRAHLLGTQVLNYKVIGSDDDIEKYHREGFAFLITIGQIKSAEKRKAIFERLSDLGAETPVIISKTAYVSPYAKIEMGTIIMGNAFVNIGASIGANTIINSNALIEHDVSIGNHTHVSTSAVINGDSYVGDETFIGSNVTVSNQVRIGNHVVVGAGSVVINDIEEHSTAVGVPAKIIQL